MRPRRITMRRTLSAVAGPAAVVVVFVAGRGFGFDDGVVGEHDGAVFVAGGPLREAGRQNDEASATRASASNCSRVLSGPNSPRSAWSCLAASCNALVTMRPSSALKRTLAVNIARS